MLSGKFGAIGQIVLSGLSGKLRYRGYREIRAIGAIGKSALSGLSGKLRYRGYRENYAIGLPVILLAI